jgi:hypothetical protein
MSTAKWIGLATAAVVALAVAWNFGDMRRYIKIEMM